MSVADIRDRMSSNWGDFSRDPMNYRLHGGESIGDLVRVRRSLNVVIYGGCGCVVLSSYTDEQQRLSSFVVEVERQRKPVLIVSHFLNLQVLYGYLLGRNVSEGLEMSIPLHTVIKLTPTQYGYKEERFDLRSTTLSDAIAKVDVAN
jgi:broad specificity phosphatase PhoE